ncbi:tRNA 2-thiouridine(34) synthase MnmA [Chlamydiota bacterium]
MSTKKVLVAMSGGVDSSVAAYLLKKQGYEVIGITMCLGVKETTSSRAQCCGKEAIEDARRVCHQLGISHFVLDFSSYLEKYVIKKFISSFRRGKTPNPCIDCNTSLKFDLLFKNALTFGCDYFATGHYASIVKENNTFIVKKAIDSSKDQTYFLYTIKAHQLSRILFPLGSYLKKEVRSIAEKVQLPNSNKKESQDICFVPTGNYKTFLKQRIKPVPGDILHVDGTILGKHKGILFYTVGQREGLGISFSHPLYVIKINYKTNQILVGEREYQYSSRLIAKNCNFFTKERSFPVSGKIRYLHQEEPCKITPYGGKRIEVVFKEPQQSIAPGQSIVFYAGDIVIGGGEIEEVFAQ